MELARAIRKISIVSILVALFANMITCASGRADITNYIIVIVNAMCLAILIKFKRDFNKLFRSYKGLLKDFKNFHAQRYWSGNQEEVETIAQQILEMGPYLKKHACASKRQIREVEYICEEIEKLRKTM